MARRSPFDSQVCLFSLLLLSLLLPWSALAQEQPAETLPGFKPNNILESHGIDNVNIFSGDPGIVIPLGPVYPLGPGNSWQLKAYYSAKLWSFDNDDCAADSPPSTGVQHAYIRGYPTIGAGWTLGVGYINSGADSDDFFSAGYYSPDGAKHTFQPNTGSPPYVTTDGSHLRVTPYPATGTPSYYTVEFPDGTKHTFGHQFLRPRPVSGTSSDFTDVTWSWKTANIARYGLSMIQDAFGTTLLTVDYVSNALDNSSWKILHVNLNPGTPQSRQVVFNWGAAQGGIWDAIGSISFPTANGTLTASFIYNFPVSPAPVVNRNTYDNSNATSVTCRTGSIAQVHMLSTVTLSAPSITTLSYGFSYHLDASSTPDGVRDGALEHVGLPTGGTIDYAYDVTAAYCFLYTGTTSCPDPETGATVTVSNPAAPCSLGVLGHGFARKFWDASAGVVSRTETDPIAGVSEQTSYTRTQFVPTFISGSSAVPDDCGVTRSVVVTRPSGNGSGQLAERHVFHVQVDPGEGGGAELERRVYGENAGAVGAPVRTVVNCHENDSVAAACGFRNSSGQSVDYRGGNNPRLQAQVTWFGTNPTGGGTCAGTSPPCNTSVSSGYNVTAGQYGTVTSSSTLSGTATRVSTTHWTPVTSPWLLNLFDHRTETEGSSSVNRYFDFNNANGFLKGVLIHDPTYQLVFLNCRYPDSSGHVSQEFTQTLAGWPSPPPTTYCSTTYPTMPGLPANGDSFGRVHTNRQGLRLTTRWVNGSVPAAWDTINVVRDTNTGVVTSSTDSAAFSTAYAYDSLGRLRAVTPSGTSAGTEAPTQISYDSGNQTTVTRNGGTGLSTWMQYRYDGFGRLLREIRQMPVGSASAYAVRLHRYDVAGRAAFDSEWSGCADPASCAAVSVTQGDTSSNFDPFGRPQTLTRTDGSQTTVSFADGAVTFSDSSAAITVNNIGGTCAAGTCSGGSSSSTTHRYDGYGKLISVTEPTGELTSYTYDVSGHLASVVQGTQTRTYTRDTAGFLRSETTPERGSVAFSSYGSLGNLLSSTEPGGLVVNRSYDFAGRVTGISTNEGGSRTYLVNRYDEMAGYSAGKLTSRTATNYAISPPPTVTDSFVYSGLGGRLSQQTESVSGTSNLAVTQSWQYNALGLLASHHYPRPAGATPFVVSVGYDAGLAVAQYINGIPMITSILYYPSGMLRSYTTGLNIGRNVTTSIALDANLAQRPSRISSLLQGASTASFDSGPFAYDGGGNATAIGSDTFTYDSRSRLISVSLAQLGSQAFSYDRYGNLLTKGGTTYCSGTCTNNRLPGPSWTYDTRGNLTLNNAETYGYDGLNRLTLQHASVDWSYLYDGDDERVARIPPAGGTWTYTFRDPAAGLISEFAGGTPSRDNVYLERTLVASYANAAVGGNGAVWNFYASDHIGSPRLVTDSAGGTIEQRRYWPYGEDAGSQSAFQRIRFAGMERDTEGSRYLDHARSYAFNLGRFVSPEPGWLGAPMAPQTWNAYSYSNDNPLKYKDPDGDVSLTVWGADVAGLFQGREDVQEYMRDHPRATFGQRLGKYSIGFIAGFGGTLAGGGAAELGAGPLVAGAVQGGATSIIDQGLNAQFFPTSVFGSSISWTKVLKDAGEGGLAGKFFHRLGLRPPKTLNVWAYRPVARFGKESLRYIVDELMKGKAESEIKGVYKSLLNVFGIDEDPDSYFGPGAGRFEAFMREIEDFPLVPEGTVIVKCDPYPCDTSPR